VDSGKERGISALVVGDPAIFETRGDSERFRDCSSICQVENLANGLHLELRMNPEMEIGTDK
jgi:hypothetical protein